MSLARSLHLVAMAAIALAASAQTVESRLNQPVPSESTAQLIGVSSEISQLKKLSADPVAADRWQLLWLHQRISEQVMAASLQVDATIAQIDNEIARCNEVHGFLSDRRDHAVSRANLLSVIVGGAVGATSSGLQLSSNLTKPAAGVGIAAGTLSAGLALTGIRDQKGQSGRFDFESNMLAELFDRPTLANSRYPETVWIFLNEPVPSSHTGITRKEELLQTWVQVKRIDSLSSTDKNRSPYQSAVRRPETQHRRLRRSRRHAAGRSRQDLLSQEGPGSIPGLAADSDCETLTASPAAGMTNLLHRQRRLGAPLPRFPAEARGVDTLPAPFLNERRTRGPL